MPIKKILSSINLKGFKVESYGLSHLAKLLPVLGAFISIALVVLAGQLFVPTATHPVLIASMGASAVLLFVVPSSPMAQPWPFIGGHLISAFVGVTSFYAFDDIYLAAAVAVSVSILAMMYLGCLHPPGGAASLAFILGGAEIQALGFQYILLPVAMNVALMLVLSMALNNARFLIKRSPKVRLATSFSQAGKSKSRIAMPFVKQDLSDALNDMETFIDISHEDLCTIYSLALSHSQIRDHKGKKCKDIMLPVRHTIEYGNSLEEAWHIMQANELHGMVVVDRVGHVIGVITITDFLEHANTGQEGELEMQVEKKIENLIAPSKTLETTKPEAVGQIMSSPVVTVNLEDDTTVVLSVFKKYQAHMTPVVDKQKKLLGLITMSEMQ